MTRLTVQDMRRAIEEAAEDLITAAGPDGMVSREDIQQKLAKREGAYRDLLEAFYNLLRDESQPYQRVTRRVIQEGVAFVREQIIGQMEVTPGALTAAEQAALSVSGMDVLVLGAALKRTTGREVPALTSRAIFRQIADNAPGVFFDYLGSESSEAIEAVLIPARAAELTPKTFAEALQLDLNDPTQVIERFVSAKPFFEEFAEQHAPFGLDAQAAAIAQVMQEHLTHNSIFVLGRDNEPAMGSQHPAYVVGLASDGYLVGFRSIVVWT